MWRHVKEKRNFIEFDLRNVSAKKHKETLKACITFRSIIFSKKTYFAFTLVQYQNTDQEKSHFQSCRFLKVLQDLKLYNNIKVFVEIKTHVDSEGRSHQITHCSLKCTEWVTYLIRTIEQTLIQNPLRHLRWSLFQIKLTAFSRYFRKVPS